MTVPLTPAFKTAPSDDNGRPLTSTDERNTAGREGHTHTHTHTAIPHIEKGGGIQDSNLTPQTMYTPEYDLGSPPLLIAQLKLRNAMLLPEAVSFTRPVCRYPEPSALTHRPSCGLES